MLAMQGPASAEDIPGQLFDHLGQRAWLENYDPTLVSSRLVAEFSYESQNHDQDCWKLETTLRCGIPLRDDLALGLQMMVPTKWNESPAAQESGLGDLELRAGIVGRISPTMRYGVAINAAFDTASAPALGDNALVLRPILACRWDASDRLNLGLNVEYNFTPCDADDYDQSSLELKFPLVVKLNDDWSAAITYKPKWNFLTDSVRQRLELGATRTWGNRNQYAWSFAADDKVVPVRFDDLSLDHMAVPRTIVYRWNLERVMATLAARAKL